MRRTRSAPAPLPRVEPNPLLGAVAKSFPGASPPVAIAGRPQLVQFDSDDGRWLIRGLSSEQTPGLISGRHQFLAEPAIASAGIGPLPHPHQATGQVEGAPYEVVSYLPGTSWAMNGRLMLDGHGLHRPLPPPTGGLASLAAQIARIHVASEQVALGRLPKVTVRDHLQQKRDQWQRLSDRIAASRVREVHVERWKSASQRVVFASWDVLEASSFLESTPLVGIHGDLWPTHVLSDGDGVRLVDWRRASLAHPLIDIAQLIGRFAGWSASALEEVVESYMAVRTLIADERRILPVFGALDLAIETGVILAEAYIAEIDQTSHYAELARTGAGQMLASLESIGWSIRKTNMDSTELRREARDRARAVREPGQKPRPRRLSSKRPKQ
jgi:aminoglycoside phosphotransferase (APT) family kinase protein